jgi:hypothetical protein
MHRALLAERGRRRSRTRACRGQQGLGRGLDVGGGDLADVVGEPRIRIVGEAESARVGERVGRQAGERYRARSEVAAAAIAGQREQHAARRRPAQPRVAVVCPAATRSRPPSARPIALTPPSSATSASTTSNKSTPDARDPPAPARAVCHRPSRRPCDRRARRPRRLLTRSRRSGPVTELVEPASFAAGPAASPWAPKGASSVDAGPTNLRIFRNQQVPWENLGSMVPETRCVHPETPLVRLNSWGAKLVSRPTTSRVG